MRGWQTSLLNCVLFYFILPLLSSFLVYSLKSSAIPTTPRFIFSFFLGAGLKGIALCVYDFFIFDFNDERQAAPFTFPLYSQRLNYFPFCRGRRVIRCGRKRDEFNIEFTVPQPM